MRSSALQNGTVSSIPSNRSVRNGGDSGGTPAISVDQNKIDYGYVKFGEDRQFTLKVTNAGNSALRFKEKPFVEVLEGC